MILRLEIIAMILSADKYLGGTVPDSASSLKGQGRRRTSDWSGVSRVSLDLAADCFWLAYDRD